MLGAQTRAPSEVDRRVSLLRLNELVEVAKLAPFADDQITLFIDGGAVRGVADAIFPLVLGQTKVCTLLLVRIIAYLRYDVTGLVQNGGSTLKFGKNRVIAANINCGGHAKIFLDHFYEIAVQIPIFDSVIVSVADEEQGFSQASVQGDSVACFEFAFRFARAAERFYKLAIFVEFKHVIGAISIGHENRSVWTDRNRAGIKSLFVFIDASFGRIMNRPLGIALKIDLHHFVVRRAGAINVFHSLFLAQFQTVNASGAECAQIFAVRGKYHDTAFGIGGDVNVSRLIDNRPAVARPQLLIIWLFLKEMGGNGVVEIFGEAHRRGKCGG
ncbi:MAG: hypothetical protein JWM99_3525 [Verrucomicrobiales bacterium]|nr:hypothetical protein [Verrucomicrobiales bacterium]